MLRAGIAERGYVGNLVVQGSRASGRAIEPGTDLDLALRVEPTEFDRILNEQSKMAKPTPGSANDRSRIRSIEHGRIFAREANLASVRNKIKEIFPGMTVQLSVIKIGGRFDNGAQIPIEGDNP